MTLSMESIGIEVADVPDTGAEGITYEWELIVTYIEGDGAEQTAGWSGYVSTTTKEDPEKIRASVTADCTRRLPGEVTGEAHWTLMPAAPAE